MAFKAPNKYRVRYGFFATENSAGNNGAFSIPLTAAGDRYATAICSDGDGWEHVSISFPDRTPTWDEMCEVKEVFWGEEDTVMQLHPPKSEYVNNHQHCLHLWRPVGAEIPRPPSLMVGVAKFFRETKLDEEPVTGLHDENKEPV